MKTVLVATMGTTPSVLASTVWELAVHPQEFLGEETSIVPDKIVVFGTARSKAELSKALFHRDSGKKPTGWELLRSALEKSGFDVSGKLQFSVGNIITFRNDAGEEIDDIRNTQDCYYVANAIVKELRDLTVRDDCRILASMSGGRKPESALLLSCMNILGRERDAVLHLVPLKWPTPTVGCDPPFLFPGQGAIHSKKDEKAKRPLKFKSEAIQFSLINIPFIRVRNCLPDLEGGKPLPSFGELVSRSQRTLDQVANTPVLPFVRFDFVQFTISLSAPGVDLVAIRLRPEGFFVLACDLILGNGKMAVTLFDRIRRGQSKPDEHPLLRAIHNTRIRVKEESWKNEDDIGKVRWRTKDAVAKKGGRFAFVAESLAGKGNYRGDNTYPSELIFDEDRKTFRRILNSVGALPL